MKIFLTYGVAFTAINFIFTSLVFRVNCIDKRKLALHNLNESGKSGKMTMAAYVAFPTTYITSLWLILRFEKNDSNSDVIISV